jgi:hypothetical protein
LARGPEPALLILRVDIPVHPVVEAEGESAGENLRESPRESRSSIDHVIECSRQGAGEVVKEIVPAIVQSLAFFGRSTPGYVLSGLQPAEPGTNGARRLGK